MAVYIVDNQWELINNIHAEAGVMLHTQRGGIQNIFNERRPNEQLDGWRTYLYYV